MNTSSRLAPGYRPDFDIDALFGKEAEDFVLRELFVGIITRAVEVKRDGRWRETGNLYVEVEQSPHGKSWRPSGLMTTDADYQAYVLGNPSQALGPNTSMAVLVLPTTSVRAYAASESNNFERTVLGGTKGDNPTRGVLLSTSRLLASIRRESWHEPHN